jgi:hypothetical protein
MAAFPIVEAELLIRGESSRPNLRMAVYPSGRCLSGSDLVVQLHTDSQIITAKIDDRQFVAFCREVVSKFEAREAEVERSLQEMADREPSPRG